MKKAGQRLIRLALSAIIIVGLVLFARTVNWHETWDRIANADLAAALFNVDASWAALVAGVADNYFSAAGLSIQLAEARDSVRIEGELERVALQIHRLACCPAHEYDRLNLAEGSVAGVHVRMTDAADWL